jgi:hypothetical protein
MGTMALDAGPIPKIYLFNIFEVFIFGISIALFWKWPLVAVAMAWFALTFILAVIVPWGTVSAHMISRSLQLEYAFFVAAHLGFIASRFLQPRTSTTAVN